MPWHFVGFASFLVVFLSACEADPGAEMRPRRSTADASPDAEVAIASDGASVALDPPATEDGVARVVRIRLTMPVRAEAERALLVEGSLSPSQLRDLERSVVSKTLAARRVDALVWIAPDDERTLVAQPLRPLAPGHAYTLAAGTAQATASFEVAVDQPLVMLRRVWPIPHDGTASPRFAVYCGASPIVPSVRGAAFEPGGVLGELEPGIGAGIDVPECVRWNARDDGASGAPIVPPPAIVLGDGTTALLDPSPLEGSASAPEIAAEPCRSEEVAVANLCLDIDDDRLVVRPGPSTALVAVRVGEATRVEVPKLGERFVVRPLATEASLEVHAAMLDAAGRVTEGVALVTTAKGHPHVVINEVYARPNGPEPAQEWLELVNDGVVAADLGGMTIQTGGASTALPSVVLDAGSYALVARETFSADDGVDPPPASGSRVIRVPKLGKAGMSNEGAEVRLCDAEGNVVSRFPPSPKPKKGVSVIRVAPEALDESPSSFAYDPNDGSTPGMPNPKASIER